MQRKSKATKDLLLTSFTHARFRHLTGTEGNASFFLLSCFCALHYQTEGTENHTHQLTEKKEDKRPAQETFLAASFHLPFTFASIQSC